MTGVLMHFVQLSSTQDLYLLNVFNCFLYLSLRDNHLVARSIVSHCPCDRKGKAERGRDEAELRHTNRVA